MYKVIMLDNYLDSSKIEIYEKEYEGLETAEEAYAGVFEQAKKLILEVLKLMLEIDKTQASVIQQIIEVVKDAGSCEPSVPRFSRSLWSPLNRGRGFRHGSLRPNAAVGEQAPHSLFGRRLARLNACT